MEIGKVEQYAVRFRGSIEFYTVVVLPADDEKGGYEVYTESRAVKRDGTLIVGTYAVCVNEIPAVWEGVQRAAVEQALLRRYEQLYQVEHPADALPK